MSADDTKANATSEAGAGKKAKPETPPRAEGERAKRYERGAKDERYEDRALTSATVRK